MIIHYLNVKGVAIGKLEAKAPPPIDCHRPLGSPASFQLVKAYASQIPQLGKICRCIEGCEELMGSPHIESAEARSLAKFIKSTRSGIRERLDHTFTVLRSP